MNYIASTKEKQQNYVTSEDILTSEQDNHTSDTCSDRETFPQILKRNIKPPRQAFRGGGGDFL